MRRIDVGGYRLRVDAAGDGPETLLCLHGLVDRLEIWDAVWEGVAGRGRALRVDQRGHGESEAPPGPCRREDLAADVLGLLDALGVARAVLVGHSLGGIVAMTTALAHPERVAGLVLLGTAGRCSAKLAEWYGRIAAAGEREGTGGLARAIYGERTRRGVSGDARAIAQVTRTLQSLHGDPLAPRLAAVRCPASVRVGSDDPMGARASREIAEALPDADFAVVPGVGHWIQRERPEAVLEAIDALLARLVR